MKKLVQRGLMAMVITASLCGAAAGETQKDWYLALRFGYQPYSIDVEGTLAGRDFDASADLSDIWDDTTMFGGDVEFGKGNWFIDFFGFYQKTDVNKGDGPLSLDATFKETVLNPMLGYRIYQSSSKALTVKVMAGASYVNVDSDIDVYQPSLSISKDVDFVDPMVGSRAYLALARWFGVSLVGEVGGFGVGSELQYLVAGNLVFHLTRWFALSAGYSYWYWKYEDDDALLSRLEQSVYGPLVGVQFRF